MGLIEHWLVRAGTPDIWENPTDKFMTTTHNDVRVFRLKDLRSAFYIVFSGCTLSAFVFLAELLPKLLCKKYCKLTIILNSHIFLMFD